MLLLEGHPKVLNIQLETSVLLGTKKEGSLATIKPKSKSSSHKKGKIPADFEIKS